MPRPLGGSALAGQRGTKRMDDPLRIARDPEYAALLADHRNRGEMVRVVRRAGSVGEHQALESAVIRFAHRRMHANVGGDPRKNEVRDAARAQDVLEVGRVEAPLPGLSMTISPGIG